MTSADRPAPVVRLCQQGEYARAACLARRHLLGSPDDGRLLEVYGIASWHAGDPDSALEALEKATALVPLNPPAQLALACCYGPWFASFTETLENYNPGLIATGSSLYGFATRLVGVPFGIIIPHVIGSAGLVVGEADIAGWSAALTALIEGPAERATLAERGRVRAIDEFAWPVIARRHLEFFEERLATRRPQ